MRLPESACQFSSPIVQARGAQGSVCLYREILLSTLVNMERNVCLGHVQSDLIFQSHCDTHNWETWNFGIAHDLRILKNVRFKINATTSYFGNKEVSVFWCYEGQHKVSPPRLKRMCCLYFGEK